MIGHVVSPVFVGRTGELEALSAAYDQAIADGPTIALVAGEAGIGKSRLVAEFVTALGREPRVLVGGCLELGADGLPYAPFMTITRRLVRDLGPERVARFLPGRAPSLARWLPELGENDRHHGAQDQDQAQGQGRLFEEILTLVEHAAADRPLVCLLEDLHWADTSSRDLLVFLARNLTEASVLIIGTYRTADLDGSRPLRPLLAELGRLPRVHLVEPAPLSRPEVGRQLAAILGRDPEPALVAHVHERSEGNPLFVEALAEPGDSTPSSLRQLLLGPLADVPERTRRVLRAAAVAGTELSHALLETLTGLDDLELENAVRQIVDRQLLVPTQSGYAFRHALIRSAVYDDLLPGERVRLHARCADALLAQPSLVPEGRAPAELAAHLFAAGDAERALGVTWEAAESSRLSYAYDEQVLMLERVLDLWDRVADPVARLGVDHAAVLETMARACLASGDAERGVALATAALGEVDEEQEPERAAGILTTRSTLRARIDVSGLEDMEAALRLVPADPPGPARGWALAGLAATHLSLADHRPAQRPAEEALAIARHTGDANLLALALTAVAFVTGLDGDVSSSMARFSEAREVAKRVGNDYVLLTAVLWQADVLLYVGEDERAADVVRYGVGHAQRVGLLRTRGTILAGALVAALFHLGRWPEAEEVLENAFTASPPPLYVGWLNTYAGELALARGDLDRAADAAAATEAAAQRGPSADRFLRNRYHLRCLLAVAQGDPEAADELAARGLADVDALPGDPWLIITAAAEVQRARLGRAARDPDAKRRIERRQAELRSFSGKLTATTPVERALRATFLAEIDDRDVAGWDEAVGAWRELRYAHWLAKSLLRGAEAALAGGDKPGAEVRLREAATIAAELRAVTLGREIEKLAARGRLRLRDAEPSPTGAANGSDVHSRLGLTRRELEVLRLVAEGRSNREIGAELFISPNTAGVHVSNILTKLDVTSRLEAAAIAHRSGLLDAVAD